ncbi:MAG: DNA-binding response regulator [Ilumatobacteraceae bacterium]|nr:DNA-binding response regulator [Ilumatobacteraceae bacterium]
MDTAAGIVRIAGISRDRVRTIVADPHPIAATGLASCLSDNGFDVCGVVGDVLSLNSLVELARPALVVMETDLHDHRESLAAITTLVMRYSSRILAFTADISGKGVHSALESGCLGVVPRTASVADLLAGARAVAAGERHVHPLAIAAVLRASRSETWDHTRPALTAREFSVLSLIADGCSNGAIASRLGLSSATIKTHVERILRRLSADDRAHAVATAMRLGLLH